MTRQSRFSKFLPKRKPDTHKGDYGHVLVLAGSPGLTGAAYLCSQGALVSGSGLVTLGIPRSLNSIMAVKLTEVMTKLLPETESGTLSLKAYDEILDFIDKVDVVAIGPGLSTHKETVRLVRKLITSISKPIVIDADGLNALAGSAGLLKKAIGPVVITPHPGEMARLVGISTSEIQKDRKAIALKSAKEYNLTVVLKGYHSVVANQSGKMYINTTGNPGMATGGTGDILTGMIASFIGQGISAFDAARLGVYLHGLAGDLAAKYVGEVSLTAGDILRCLPKAIKTNAG
ncbi:MAG: NAD(P)H-hydrate dehydratase [Candidatus Omnitrophica bacterium]|nr:NAD(P)H-hydrate dehydratase [Candidatus Omnitrophota bacterium]